MSLTRIGSIGINTGIKFSGLTTITTLNSSIDTLSIGGPVSIAGTLTYEDVTNIDSVGLITARNGIVVGSGITLSKDGDGFFTGVITATSYSGIDLSNVTGAQGDFSIADKIVHTGDTNTAIRFPNADTFTVETTGVERARIDSNGIIIGRGELRLTQGTSSLSNGDEIGSLMFIYPSNSEKNAKVTALQTTGTSGADLAFFTRVQGDASNTDGGTEKLRITSAGNVGINSTVPEAQLTVLKTSTVANSLTFKAAAGQIFRNEDAEFAFGLSSSNPYPLFIQGRYKDNSARNIAINPLGGLLLLGSEKVDNNVRLGNKLAIVGTTAYTGMSITNYPGTNAQHSPLFDFNRSRGTSDGSLTAVVAGDKLGELIFRGSNGSDFTDAVRIATYVDSVSGSHVNGKFQIETYSGGAASEALSVDSNRKITATQSSSNIGLDLHATGSGRGSQIKIHNDHATAYVGISGDTNGNLLLHNEENAAVILSTSNTARLRINSNGTFWLTGADSGYNATFPSSSSGARIQIGSHTFQGQDAVYDNNRLGMQINGSLSASLMLADTYNDATHPGYGYVMVQGPTTSSYNTYGICPDGPARGTRMNFCIGAQSDNIHSDANTKQMWVDANGNAYKRDNTTTWSTTSDERLKKNIVNNNKGLAEINQLRVTSFEYRKEEEIDMSQFPLATDPRQVVIEGEDGPHTGVIAQEIENIFPECVQTSNKGAKTVDADAITWALVNAIKELSAKNDVLEAEIAALKG